VTPTPFILLPTRCFHQVLIVLPRAALVFLPSGLHLPSSSSFISKPPPPAPLPSIHPQQRRQRCRHTAPSRRRPPPLTSDLLYTPDLLTNATTPDSPNPNIDHQALPPPPINSSLGEAVVPPPLPHTARGLRHHLSPIRSGI
jgi:hypothetical protein